MASKVVRRKIALYRMNMSGLDDSETYESVLLQTFQNSGELSNRIRSYGERSHALQLIELNDLRLRMRFISFKVGERPDILDTDDFNLTQNPLQPSQTAVVWTHAFGGFRSGKFYLLLEEHLGSTRAGQLERYLQYLIDEWYRGDRRNPIIVSIEAQASQEFLQRIDELDRITLATMRIPSPNPGWWDLKNELGEEASNSDAHKVDVTMTARRRGSLRRDRGIVGAIRSFIEGHDAVYARIEGQQGGEMQNFSTEKLQETSYVRITTDEFGQVVHGDMWETMADLFGQLK